MLGSAGSLFNRRSRHWLEGSEKLVSTVRAAPWWLHALAYSSIILTSIWVSPLLVHAEFLTKLSQATSQWLDERFVSTLILQTFRIVVVLFVVGRLSLGDVGIRRELILPAIVVLLLFWLSVQTLRTLECIALTGRIATKLPFGGDVNRLHAVKGIVVASVCEEVLFRGFFMVQFYKLAHERLSFGPGGAALASIGASAVLFVVAHIPGRIFVDGEVFGEMIPSVARTLAVGIVLGVVLARTANIFVAAGVHCCLNLPLNVVRAPQEVPVHVQWGIELALLVIVIHLLAVKLSANRTVRSDGALA